MKAGAALTLALIGSLSISQVAEADPITHFGTGDGGGLVINTIHALTAEDLAVLAARDDNGLHLGWFRSDRRQAATKETSLDVVVAIGYGSANHVTFSPTTLNPANSSPAISNPAISSQVGANQPAWPHAADTAPDPLALTVTTASLIPTAIEASASVASVTGQPASTFATDGAPQSTGNVSAIPEPAILLLTGAGLLSLGHRVRRGNRRRFRR
jgi:hypothetical protein